jgi:multidrug resistance efflux pump
MARRNQAARATGKASLVRSGGAMLIILLLYIFLIWLLFSRLRLVRLGWASGTIAVLIGIAILATFLALFNYLTPSGRFVVVSRVIEVTPNVSGQIVEIPVKPNVPVKAGAVLFQIDPAPFKYKVEQLRAGLAQAKLQASQLQNSYDQASATVEGLNQQLAFNQKRLSDISSLAMEEANSEFRQQDTQVQVETVSAQLQAAKAAQANAKLALDAQIGGINPTVAQVTAQLDDAQWQLEQTTIRAPADGVVTIMALAVGDRAVPAKPVLSFVLNTDVMLVGMFAPNGFDTVKPGAAVKLIFDNDPGRVHHAKIDAIPEGVGQGEVAVSGTLARVGSIGGASAYPAMISIPANLDASKLKLGMSGTATAFNEKAGVVGLLMSILVWVNSYLAYL